MEQDDIRFRYAEYLDVTSYIMSEGLFDGGGDRYVYFCLDDFNHSLNPHEVCFEKYSANESVLAKIYLTDGKFAVNIDDSSNGNNIVKTRKFAGPIDLSKIKVKILDQYGDVVDLNHMDFSFFYKFVLVIKLCNLNYYCNILLL